MASWQFDIHFLPRDGVLRRYRAIPAVISSTDPDVEYYWESVPPPTNLSDQLAKALPTLETWNRDVERWGHEDGDRIDVVWDNERVSDILIRVDVRNVSQVFLVNVLQIARQNGWILRTEDGRVFPPSLRRLLLAIQASPAFQFVQDPHRFLQMVGKAADCDPDDAL